MKNQELFVSTLALCIFIIQISAARRHLDTDNDDDEYRKLKRFWLDPTTPKPWSTKTTESPWNRPSGACASNPCDHGGICYSTGQSTFECKCVGPWRGIYCGVSDACYNSPCRNGGTCLNVVNEYWCKCTNDYYGKNCESKFYNPNDSQNTCKPNICNTGQCVALQTTYYCRCPDDRYGENCEKRFYKRTHSDRRSFYELLKQIKRSMQEKALSDNDDNDDNDNLTRAINGPDE